MATTQHPPAYVNSGERPRLTIGDKARTAELARESRGLRRGTEILKAHHASPEPAWWLSHGQHSVADQIEVEQARLKTVSGRDHRINEGCRGAVAGDVAQHRLEARAGEGAPQGCRAAVDQYLRLRAHLSEWLSVKGSPC
jgi:hypothetical protein